MKVLVDASAAFNQGAGIGQYARGLLGAVDQELENADFALWYAPDRDGIPPFGRDLLERFSGQPEVIRARFSRRRADQMLFRAKLPISFQALVGKGDVAYSPDFTIPQARGIPNVITIHDLSYMIRPEFAPEPLRNYLNLVVPDQISKADRIVTVSETTRFDLLERLNIEPNKVIVVQNGVAQSFFGAKALEPRHRDALGLPEHYLLMVGTIEPRKNHLSLFTALERLESSLELPLVIAGRVGWMADPILAASAPLQVRNRVILLDYVPDVMMPGLIAGASSLVYPSWYEGFGRPLLEAMAAGVPIAASDVPAHREVAGDLAEYCDPADPSSIGDAIRRSLEPNQRTTEARKNRIDRAKEFSWVSSGKKLAATLTELTTIPSRRWKSGSPP